MIRRKKKQMPLQTVSCVWQIPHQLLPTKKKKNCNAAKIKITHKNQNLKPFSAKKKLMKNFIARKKKKKNFRQNNLYLYKQRNHHRKKISIRNYLEKYIALLKNRKLLLKV